MVKPFQKETVMAHELVLVTGGARSGKSGFAQNLVWAYKNVTFIATAEALDEEMRLRIEHHQNERPRHWQTIESPMDLQTALLTSQTNVVLLDCLSLWVSNQMLAEQNENEILTKLEAALKAHTDGLLVVVSNEVGFGIVPDNALARAYRDCLGRANQLVAAQAQTVWLLVAGVPLQIKGKP